MKGTFKARLSTKAISIAKKTQTTIVFPMVR